MSERRGEEERRFGRENLWFRWHTKYKHKFIVISLFIGFRSLSLSSVACSFAMLCRMHCHFHSMMNTFFSYFCRNILFSVTPKFQNTHTHHTTFERRRFLAVVRSFSSLRLHLMREYELFHVIFSLMDRHLLFLCGAMCACVSLLVSICRTQVVVSTSTIMTMKKK